MFGADDRKKEHSYESELGLYVMDALKPGEYEKVAVRKSKASMRRSLNTANLFKRFTAPSGPLKGRSKQNGIDTNHLRRP